MGKSIGVSVTIFEKGWYSTADERKTDSPRLNSDSARSQLFSYHLI